MCETQLRDFERYPALILVARARHKRASNWMMIGEPTFDAQVFTGQML